MSTNSYGNTRTLKLDLNFVAGITGSFITPKTGKKSSTLQGGLVGYYRLGQGPQGQISDDTTIVDHAGYVNPTIQTPGSGALRVLSTDGQILPWATTGKDFRGLIRFNGQVPSPALDSTNNSNAYLTIPAATVAKIKTSNAYSISMWFKIDKYSHLIRNSLTAGGLDAWRMGLFELTGEHVLYYKFSASEGDHKTLFLRVDMLKDDGTTAGIDRIWAFGSYDSDRESGDSKLDINIDTWYHLVCAFDMNDVGREVFPRGWINGEPVKMTASKVSHSQFIQPFDAGDSGFGMSPTMNDITNRVGFMGYIFECAIWNRILTDYEAETLHEMSYGIFVPQSGVLECETGRLRQRRLDNMSGSYPTTRRMFYNDRPGNYNNVFNDRDTVIFTDTAEMGQPYDLKKKIEFKAGPHFNVSPTIKRPRTFQYMSGAYQGHRDDPSFWLTSSIRYNKGNRLIGWWSMPQTGTLPHGAVTRMVSGTITSDCTDPSGWLTNYESSAHGTRLIPSASFDTPFSIPFSMPEDRDITLTNRRRSNQIRSMTYEAHLAQRLWIGNALDYSTAYSGSQQFSFAAWIKPVRHPQDASGYNYNYIFDLGSDMKLRLYGTEDGNYVGDTENQTSDGDYAKYDGLLEANVAWDAAPGDGSDAEVYISKARINFNEWNHIAFTLDARFGPTTESLTSDTDADLTSSEIIGIDPIVVTSITLPAPFSITIPIFRRRIVYFYINGRDAGAMVKTDSITDDQDVILGLALDEGTAVIGALSTTASTARYFFNGKMCEPAMWDVVLNADEVKAIYMSSFIVPSVVRYPLKLPHLSNRLKRIAPSSDIVTFGNVQPGTSDSRHVDRPVAGEDMSLFNDSAIFIGDGGFYEQGTPSHVLPGFESPLRSKTQIVIDIPCQESKKITRYGKDVETTHPPAAQGPMSEIDLVDENRFGAGEFLGKDATGFCYYNQETNKWNDIGVTDPIKGGSMYHSLYCQVGSAWQAIHNGLQYSPRQFYQGWTYIDDYAGVSLADFAAKKGRPMMEHFAPNATMYHATASQCISMKKYISAPWVLEKAVLEIPVELRRVGHAGTSKAIGMGASNPHGDMYMFFLYRQEPFAGTSRWKRGLTQTGSTRQRQRFENENYVKGSTRHIICSGGVSFYSDQWFRGTDYSEVSDSGTGWVDYTPSYSSAVMIKKNWDTTITDRTHQILEHTGTLRIKMTPAVQPRSTHGVFYPEGCLLEGGNSSTITSSARWLPSRWPGGTTTKTLWGYFAEKTAVSEDIMIALLEGAPERKAYLGTFGEGVTNAATTVPNIAVKRGHPTYELPGLPSNIRIRRTSVSRPALETHLSGTIPNARVTYSGDNWAALGSTPWDGFNVSGDTWGSDIFKSDPRTLSTTFGSSLPPATVNLFNYVHIPHGAGGAPPEESPYILMPEDDLVLGIDAVITTPYYHITASNASMVRTGSMITLTSGLGKLTLFGSYVKELREVQPELNQHLTSDAVHEMIGGDPIYDQWDISPLYMLTGSYVDMKMRGRMHSVRSGSARIRINTNYSFHIDNDLRGTHGAAAARDHITLTSADGTTKKYLFDSSGSSTGTAIGGDTVAVKIQNLGHPHVVTDPVQPREGESGFSTLIATQLRAAILDPDGHGGKFRVIQNENNLHIIQKTPGWKGATEIRYSNLSGSIKAPKRFTGVSDERAPIRSYVGKIDPTGYFERLHGADPSNNQRSNMAHGKFAGRNRVELLQKSIGHFYGRDLQLKGDISRNVRLTCPTERFYDTLLPDFKQYMRRNGGGYFPRIMGTGSASQNSMLKFGNRGYRVSQQVATTGKTYNSGAQQTAGPENIFLQGKRRFDNVYTFAQTSGSWHGYHGRHESSTNVPGSIYVSGSEYRTLLYREGEVYDPKNGKHYFPRMRFPYEGNPVRRMSQKGMRLHLSSTLAIYSSEVNHDPWITLFNYNTNILQSVQCFNFYQAPNPGDTGARDPHHDPDQFHNFASAEKIKHLMYMTDWHEPNGAKYGITHKSVQAAGGAMTTPRLSGIENIHGGAMGFKYGVQNIKPEKSSAVFRRDTYGQFRDMLEQRLMARYYLLGDTKRQGLRGHRRNKKRSHLGVAPVICRFVSASDGITPIKPSSTQCSNLSIFATSSIPFREGNPGNVEYSTLVIDGTTVAIFGSDDLSFDFDLGEIPIEMLF